MNAIYKKYQNNTVLSRLTNSKARIRCTCLVSIYEGFQGAWILLYEILLGYRSKWKNLNSFD